MKVAYVALDPLKYPRVKKIAYSLKKHHLFQFHVMLPMIQFASRGNKMKRLVYAIIKYAIVLLQIFFVRSDIFWVANCPDILALPLILRGKRYILEYRSPWPSDVEREFGCGSLVRLAAIVENFALKHASLITLTTSKLMVKIKEFRKPVLVIPNYPLENFGVLSVSRSEFRRRCDCRDGDKVVLFVGKLTRVEGADLLPSLIENVLKKADVVFWIVGDGPLYPLLEEFGKRFPKEVRLFGWRSYEEIPNFVAAADVCIAPLHRSSSSFFYNEEGVQKLSEYMFFEKPIIACGVARSDEYLLVDEDGMADGILKALNGMVQPPKRRTWEDHSEKKIYEMFSLIQSIKT